MSDESLHQAIEHLQDAIKHSNREDYAQALSYITLGLASAGRARDSIQGLMAHPSPNGAERRSDNGGKGYVTTNGEWGGGSLAFSCTECGNEFCSATGDSGRKEAHDDCLSTHQKSCKTNKERT